MRVVQAELPGARVHLVDEFLLRPRDSNRQVESGIVRALEQQRGQQVAHLHALAPAEVDLRLDRTGGVGRRRECPVELAALERQQRGHELGRAGDRPAYVGAFREQRIAGTGVDDDCRGCGVQRRALDPRRCGGRREHQCQRYEQGRQEGQWPLHYFSLIC